MHERSEFYFAQQQIRSRMKVHNEHDVSYYHTSYFVLSIKLLITDVLEKVSNSLWMNTLGEQTRLEKSKEEDVKLMY